MKGGIFMATKRLLSLWSRLDDYLQDNEYYDDVKKCYVSETNESNAYLAVVSKDDLKFLGSDLIRSEIHKFITDYSYRHKILFENKLF